MFNCCGPELNLKVIFAKGQRRDIQFIFILEASSVSIFMWIISTDLISATFLSLLMIVLIGLVFFDRMAAELGTLLGG